MAESRFNIPEEFRSDLRVVDLPDKRSDDEIIQSLNKFITVTSEKNIWAFWDKGLDALPAWCKRNVCGWVRICGNGERPWTIRVLDAVPDSPNYALNYTSKDLLPQAFVAGEMTGPYVGPHSADFLRGALLYQHGGVFMDVGNFLFRHMDRIGWRDLEDPDSPYQIAVPIMHGQTIANHFVMARKGDPFIKRWHDLFVHFWQGRKEHKGIIQHPLLGFAADLKLDDPRAALYKWDFKVELIDVLEYISQVLAWIRLTMLEDAGDGFSGSEYWQKHILVFDSLKEDWPAEETIAFNGEKIYQTLCTRLDADPSSEEYRLAYKAVWRMLTSASLQKVTHGKGLSWDIHLGVLWDQNPDKDIEPGTFAELLRYGSTHFEQTRQEIVRLEAKKAVTTMKKGLFEA